MIIKIIKKRIYFNLYLGFCLYNVQSTLKIMANQYLRSLYTALLFDVVVVSIHVVVSGSSVVVSVIGGSVGVVFHSVVEGGIVVVGCSDVAVVHHWVVVAGVVLVIGGVVVVGTAGHAPNEAQISSGGVLTKSSMIWGN